MNLRQFLNLAAALFVAAFFGVHSFAQVVVAGASLFPGTVSPGGGGGGGTAFSSITSGTNTTAAMVVGTGGSLGVSGSGTIAATTATTASAAPFSGLTGSTNSTAAMLVGTGASLDVSGSGTINATTLLGQTWTLPTIVGFTLSAPAVTTGTAQAYGATLTVDVTKPLTTLSLTGNCTETFSATPTTGTRITREYTADGTTRTITPDNNLGAVYFNDLGTTASSFTVTLNTTKTVVYERQSGRWAAYGTGVSTTGSGSYVLATSPTLVTPALGTPASGVLTNATGLTEGGLSLTDITTNNSSTSKHGFLLKLDNTATHYMDGTGAWSTPPSSGATLGANTFTRLQTITQGTANEGIIASTGYSITGSNATNMVDLAGTWNTSGAATAIKLNMTNTSGASCLLLDLQTASTSRFRVAPSGSVTTLGSINIDTSQGYQWSGGSAIYRSSDGVFAFYDNANTSFGRLQLGGTTASFPAIKRSAATLAFRLADDSADASVSMAALVQSGKNTTYNNVATAGWGHPAIYAAGRVTAQTAAAASISTYTVGAADGSFIVSGNVLVTASTTHAFTMTCTYTDEGNTSRTLTFNFSTVGGTLGTSVANAGGTVPYEGVPVHIRAKASTAITIATAAGGVYTSVTYNAEGVIQQVL